jgi:hypothetical protein
MTRPRSVAFKRKIVQRLTGKKAVSASQFVGEASVRQQNLSPWLADARNFHSRRAEGHPLPRPNASANWSVNWLARRRRLLRLQRFWF